MNIILMIFAMLVVMFGANFYILYRLWHLISAFPAGRIIVISAAVFLVVFLIVSPIISLGFGDRFPYSVSSFLFRIGTSWLIILLYLVIIFFVLDMIRITGLLPLKELMFSSWTGFGILTFFAVALMTVGNINYHKIRRVELVINIDNSIGYDEPLKIVAISDLHLGYGIGTREFRKWVNLINREEPDVVLIAGDAIDNSLKPLYERNFADIFREIKTTHGIFLAPGNHEYISNIKESIDFLTKAGVTVLRDSAALVGNAYYIAGRDDRSNPKRKTIADITSSLDTSKPIILIDHQPFHFDEVEAQNIDLYIAGHTHNGQVFPIALITRAMFELSYGYLKKGNSHFYVTSGIGIWGGKFRIGSRSEYVVITIKQ